jgi:hypothetical protein
MAANPKMYHHQFRVPDDNAQRAFELPKFLSRSAVSYFSLRQRPSPRSSLSCAHRILVLGREDGTLDFDVSGIAEYEHPREADLAKYVRDISVKTFGAALSEVHSPVPNILDRFLIRPSARDINSLIELYIRRLTPGFPITQGSFGYLRTTCATKTESHSG